MLAGAGAVAVVALPRSGSLVVLPPACGLAPIHHVYAAASATHKLVGVAGSPAWTAHAGLQPLADPAPAFAPAVAVVDLPRQSQASGMVADELPAASQRPRNLGVGHGWLELDQAANLVT